MTDTIDTSLQDAGAALQAFVDGPGQAAARALDAAFAEVGNSIEASLSQAARKGQLDFESMAEAILRDLARVAAASAFGAPVGASQTFNVNVGAGGGQGAARTILSNRGAIQSALSQAAIFGRG